MCVVLGAGYALLLVVQWLVALVHVCLLPDRCCTTVVAIATVVLATGGARHTQPTAMHGKHSQASERRIEIPAEAG